MWRVLGRLWIVGTVLWVGFILLASNYDPRPNMFEIAFWAAVVPPSFIFIVGAGLRWAFTGRISN